MLPLLTIPYMLRREREMQQQRQAQRGQSSSDVMRAYGMPMGPRVDTTPAEQQRLGGIAGAIASPDRDIRLAGLGQLEQISPRGALEMEQLRLANQREALELQALQNPQSLYDPEFQATIANQLRDERSADLKPYQTQLRLFDDINSLLQPAMQGGMQTGPAAMNILFRYIKGLDDSVVRPSEGEALRGGTGIASQFVSMYNEMLGQGFITPQIAQQMHEAAATVAQQQYTAAQDVAAMHNERAAAFVEEYAFSQNFDRLAGRGMLRERSFDINPIADGDDDDNKPPPELDEDRSISFNDL